MKNLIKDKRAFLSEMMYVVLGSLIFGGAIAMFITPGQVVLGGATGIATTLNILWGLPPGTMMFAVNAILVLFGLKIFGFKFLAKTIVAVATTSVSADALALVLPVTITDPLLCCIFGTAMLGIGGGMLISRGYNTGGSDLAAVMVKSKFKRMSTGNLIFAIDIFIILGSAVVTNVMKDVPFTNVFYSILGTYLYTLAIDYMIDGSKTAKMVLIISDSHKDIADAIANDLNRGVTVLEGLGWYSQKDKHVLLCVVKRDQLYPLKTLVNRLDPKSFMILTDAKEVLGSGFSAHD